MERLVRGTYLLGWVFLVLAVLARILVYTSLVDRMVAANILPRNFLQMAVVLFLVSIATAHYKRQ